MRTCARALSRLLALLLLLAPAKPWAKAVELFRPDGSATANYPEALDSLTDGDLVRFSDGMELSVGKSFGHGTQTSNLPLLDQPALVIGIPRPSEFKTLEQAQAGMASYIEGYQALERFNIPHTRIYAGHNREYVIKKRHPKDALSLKDFLSSPGEDLAARKKASDALVKFTIQSAGFGRFGDFSSDGAQLMYSPSSNQWFLADWDHQHDPAFEIRDNKVVTRYLKSTPLDVPLTEASKRPGMEWVSDLHSRFKDAVRKERLRILEQEPQLAKDYAFLSKLNGASPSFCSRLFRRIR